ncbi:MAG: aspartate aminotransferase family protein [Hyphomicrobiaceae bacterium]
MNYMANLPPTEEIQASDAAYHLHPFTDSKQLHEQKTRVITRASGVYVYEADGRKLLDGMAGLWCVNVGYGRERINEAVHRQMSQLAYYNTFFQCTHPAATALAEKVASLTPGTLKHIFFTNSGSESNETIIRLVRHYWNVMGKPTKTAIISRKLGYHGSSMGSASLGGMTAMHRQGGLPIPGIHHIDPPYWFGHEGDMTPEEVGRDRVRQLERMIDWLGEDNVGAFIGEPIQGAAGVLIPPDNYWKEIERVCRERNILLIADEVICGFGRTGEWFGSHHFGIEPDIMAMAKGLSSGYLPIGAVAVSSKVAEGFIDKAGEFYHGYTYSGHPAACAAALENIAILEEEGLVENAKSGVGAYLRRKWLELGDHPIVGEARMTGMIGALELVPDRKSRKRFPEEGKAGTICRNISVKNDLIMRACWDRMVVSPPLSITQSEVDELIERAKKTLDETVVAVKKEGLA